MPKLSDRIAVLEQQKPAEGPSLIVLTWLGGCEVPLRWAEVGAVRFHRKEGEAEDAFWARIERETDDGTGRVRMAFRNRADE